MLDFSDLDRDKWAAVGEVTVEHFTRPGDDGEEMRVVEKVRFKLADKRAALVDLGKHLGLFIERKEVTTTQLVARMPPPAKDAEEWLASITPKVH